MHAHTHRINLTAAVALAALCVAGASAPAQADPANCQKQILAQLLKFKKSYLKNVGKCLDNQNIGKIPGPCPDAASQLKIQTTQSKIVTKLGASCTMSDLATLGFPSDCALEPESTGIEGQCAALPVTTAGEFATCLMCWKGAELAEFMATVYASHAVQICQGSLDGTSPACSQLNCTVPLPDQRDLGDSGENDCQKALGKAGQKYLVSREKILEKCGKAGGTEASCEADLAVQLMLDKNEAKLETAVQNKCGNRSPQPSLPFCCKTMGNNCVAAATREDCETGGGQVQNGKVCGVGNTCDPVGGPGGITWWGSCPSNAVCPGPALSTRQDMVDCVQQTADLVVDELLCIQFPTGWDCPVEPGSPSGAFVE